MPDQGGPSVARLDLSVWSATSPVGAAERANPTLPWAGRAMSKRKGRTPAYRVQAYFPTPRWPGDRIVRWAIVARDGRHVKDGYLTRADALSGLARLRVKGSL